VTPYFLQINKILEIIYLINKLCLLHLCCCIFLVITYRNHSKFEFELKPNKFANYRNILKIEKVLFFVSVLGQIPAEA
jgi:hypothetical protein